MEITIKQNDKKYQIVTKNKDMTVEVQNGEVILNGLIKNISTTGTYIVEIMENK